MRIGSIISLPDAHSNYGRIKDKADGSPYTIEPDQLPDGAKVGDNEAFKVELWTNGSGLAHSLGNED